jgi:hypothetical protein
MSTNALSGARSVWMVLALETLPSHGHVIAGGTTQLIDSIPCDSHS